MNRQLAAQLRRPPALDISMAALLAALSLLFEWRLITPGAYSPKLRYVFGSLAVWHWYLLVWWLASAAGLCVLPLRHRLPVTVLGVTLPMVTVHSVVLSFTPSPVDLACPIAAYTLAAARPRRVSLTMLSGGVVLAVIAHRLALASLWPAAFLGGGRAGKPPEAILLLVILAAAWLAGDGARARRAYLAEVERRASDAERDRDRQAELAAAAERARITRELHDVIAHALSVIVVQAQGGGAALRLSHPEQADAALGAIVATGRSALAETRRLLGVVRLDPADDPGLAPQPGLGRLTELLDQVRAAGTPVELRVEGIPAPLAAGVELSVFRIIQEGITNTIKHGGKGARATVRVCYGADDVCVEVTDDGLGGDQVADVSGSALPDGDGRGLSGMRARAALLGGELTAGPAPGGGFLVRARLPCMMRAGE